MKEIMISIRPKWCELIANGKKTQGENIVKKEDEVRKTRPTTRKPFKCYIYCTKGIDLWHDITGETWNGVDENEGVDKVPKLNPTLFRLNGKVIGEFICDKIQTFTVGSILCDDIEKTSCLTYAEMIDYFYKPQEVDGNTSKIGYAWHISDLKIYDEPKELSEFKKVGFMTEEDWLFALYPNTHCHYAAWAKKFEMTKPPQSWCYCKRVYGLPVCDKGEHK